MKTETKISKGNSKLGKVSNVSLPPIKACGNCKACAKDCYALKAYKQYPNVRAAWDGNFKAAKNDRTKYMNDLLEHLRKHKPRFFRWHVSGDILDQNYLNCMVSLANNFPETKFLCFTKMHNLDYTGIPGNLSIVFSMFPSMPMPPAKNRRFPIAWFQDGSESRAPKDHIECPGNCETCGMCFDLKKLDRDVVFNKH